MFRPLAFSVQTPDFPFPTSSLYTLSLSLLVFQVFCGFYSLREMTSNCIRQKVKEDGCTHDVSDVYLVCRTLRYIEAETT